MSGYVFVMGPCVACRRVFSYNPHKVPSIRLAEGKPDPNGIREPICRDCVNRANPERIKNGLPAIEIMAGAYEPMPEEEL